MLSYNYHKELKNKNMKLIYMEPTVALLSIVNPERIGEIMMSGAIAKQTEEGLNYLIIEEKHEK